MKKFITSIIFLILLSSCSGNKDSNANLVYSDSGNPYNCRAIIKDNIDGFNDGTFTATAALNSINRNCGEFGSHWKDSELPVRNSNPLVFSLERNETEECEQKIIEAVELTIDEYEKQKTNIASIDLFENKKGESTALAKSYGIINENTNLRNGFGLDNTIIKVLKKGEKVTYRPESTKFKDGYYWVIISDSNGDTGWVVLDGID